MDMKDVIPSSLLKDTPRETEGNPDFSNKDVVLQASIVGDVKSVVPTLNQVELQHDVLVQPILQHILTYYPRFVHAFILIVDACIRLNVFVLTIFS